MTGASEARVRRELMCGGCYPVHGSVTHSRMVECCDFCGLPADYEPSATAPLLAALEQAERSIEMLRSYGCGRCNGDCGSANPPVLSCPMQVARKALATITAELAKHKGAGDA